MIAILEKRALPVLLKQWMARTLICATAITTRNQNKRGAHAHSHTHTCFAVLSLHHRQLLHSTQTHTTIYNKPKQTRRFAATLGELTGGRVGLTCGSVGVLKGAVTIAIRYSAGRQQFGPPDSPEVSLA